MNWKILISLTVAWILVYLILMKVSSRWEGFISCVSFILINVNVVLGEV
jgi:hypothetical protein